jgi:hypothetical protein
MDPVLLLSRAMNTSRDGENEEPRPAEGRYANGLHVGHNAFEFVFDFLQQYADETTVQTHTRVVTSPAYAKAFLHTLTMAIAEYEREFGAIAASHSHADEDA